jgi:uncharacterized protein
MLRSVWIAFTVALLAVGAARAQQPQPPTPAPQANAAALAAARSLLTTINMTDQFKAMLPLIMQGLKPAIVQGRPEVERELDAMMPKLFEAFEPYYNNMIDGMAAIYATNFTADELAEVEAFYRRPAGQKVLTKATVLLQQGMEIGRAIGAKAAEDVRKIAVEELRKKGHKI